MNFEACSGSPSLLPSPLLLSSQYLSFPPAGEAVSSWSSLLNQR